jgi:pilus assembly protein CpaE
VRSINICPDQTLARELATAFEEIGYNGCVRVVDAYPAALDLQRVIRAHAPEVIFLSTESMPKAFETLKVLEAMLPGAPVVAIGHSLDERILLDLMRVGVREFLVLPFPRKTVAEALDRAQSQLSRRPLPSLETEHVYCFLPAKAGVGTSTIALNAAAAIAQLPDTRAILADFDLDSGMQRFMLKLHNSFSVSDAVEHSLQMDENIWGPLVSNVGHLDVLHAGPLKPNVRIESHQIRSLVEFMRRNYKALVFDLSGNLELYSIELMHESKKIFLVCTPELPSLHLAREKYAFLKSLDLHSKVSVLVNRCQKRPLITPAQIEDLLGLPVFMSFPNDYRTVTHALAAGTTVDFATEFGHECRALAAALLQNKTPAKTAEPKRKFLEHFFVSPKPAGADG